MSRIILNPSDIAIYPTLSEDKKLEFRRFAGYMGNPTNIVIDGYLNESGGKYENPYLEFIHYMSKPENFWFTCKWLLNINLHPFQVAILQELWTRKFPMLIASRGAGKTFILAIYSILRALFHQNSKVVIVGAAFRQSKLMFEYIDTIYRNSQILRNICIEHPKRDIDQCFFNIGQSKIMAIPLGDGQKIRGLRANYIIADEFACLDYNTLVETSNGLIRIGEASSQNFELINENGDFEKPVHFIKTPKTDVYKISTRYGYSFKCSSLHKVKTQNGYKLAKDLTADDWIVNENKYSFPNKPSNKKISWLLGVLVSEGYVNNKNYFTVTNTNYSLIERLNLAFPELEASIYTRPAYWDDRGFFCKESYVWQVNNTEFREYLFSLGLEYSTAHHKKVPNSILSGSKEDVISFLSGLFEGDGSCFIWNDKGTDRLGCTYYSVSETLIDDIHIILRKFDLLGSKNSRKSELSDNLQWSIRYNGKYASELVKLLNIEKFNNIVSSNQFSNKEITTGYTFDKSRNSWKAAPYFLGKLVYLGRFKTEEEAKQTVDDFMSKQDSYLQVTSVEKLEEKQILYDFYLPDTHSFYGNGFVQHNSIPLEIFEIVIKGFGSVSANPTDRAAKVNDAEILRQLGEFEQAEAIEESLGFGNQTIISGTAYYAFNHFFQYWKRYKGIIESKGDTKKLQELFQGKIEDGFNWRDYSIMRIPYESLPKGFMDESAVASSRATVHRGIYEMEYGATFAEDSDGFFKRSLIETCVTNKPIELSTGNVVTFNSSLIGNPTAEYVYGIDPASEQDNLALTILEVHPDHRRIVYCWTLNKNKLRDRLKGESSTAKTGFYSYCARKIRELMKTFPTKHIGIDTQGGGLQLIEALHSPTDMLPGEEPIWPYRVQGTPNNPDPFWWEMENKPTDIEGGLHFIHPINFAKSEWTSEANHGLKKDFETQKTLFPAYNTAVLAEAIAHDQLMGREYDTLEDCTSEIEELKDELSTIELSQTTAQSRERWDTPEIKKPGGKKGRLRKDRYSSLVIANMLARAIENRLKGVTYQFNGGYAGQGKSFKKNSYYHGANQDIIDQLNPQLYRGLSRNR